MDNDTFDLTPDYAKMRQIFSREARLNTDTILEDLLPRGVIEHTYIKTVQHAVLRNFAAVLNCLDMVTQCTTNAEQLLELKDLVHEVAQSIVTKRDITATDMKYEEEVY